MISWCCIRPCWSTPRYSSNIFSDPRGGTDEKAVPWLGVAFEVVIPKTDQPKFPPICIGCGGEPTTTFKIKADATGWWTALRWVGSMASILGGRAFDLPACEPCRKRLTRQRYLRSAGKWFFILLGFALCFWLIEDSSGLKGQLVIFGLLTLALLPWVIFERFFPPTVDMTVTGSAVTFEFADKAYADELQKLNPKV